ncbi:MAG TPA: hypothetical protein VGE52_07350 [Pirellulales bacterium]
MSQFTDSLGRLQAAIESLSERLDAAEARNAASSGGDAFGERSDSSSESETRQTLERCAAALEQLTAALDGGRIRVVVDDSTLTARYS